MLAQMLRGAAAGAAGTTALNAATYLDMVIRGRPASSTPEDTVQKLADWAKVDIPGESEQRSNRVAGLGPLLGLGAGVAAGAIYGAATALTGKPSLRGGILATSLMALLAGNAPMSVLGITDPREWDAEAWISDVVPHVAYGVVAATTYDVMA
jgi:drug/metabolite transporter (DMT)-like permease